MSILTILYRLGVARPFLMLEAFFDFALKITLQALRLFFGQNALSHQIML